MGISPIEYRPWKGERTAQKLRMYVIARSVFKHKLKSKGVLVLLALGFLLVHMTFLLIMVLVPHDRLEASEMSSYLGGGILTTFAILLASVVTSDLISDDLANNSFVLYFSRALKVRDYLVGKAGGALVVMSLLCAIPPVAVALVAMATQTGDDYVYSAGVMAKTALLGIVITVLFVPFGMMLSSFTNRKSYAAVGTFMSFFVLTIIAEIFADFSPEWKMISPVETFSFLSDWIYGERLPHYVSEATIVGIVSSFIVVPAAIVYYRITRQVVGK